MNGAAAFIRVRAPTAALFAALLVGGSAGAGACGLLDGISGGGTLSEGEVCDALRNLADFEAGCRGTAIPPESNDACFCLYPQRDICPAEWRDLEECLLDEHSCDEVDVDGACGEQLAAFVSCAGVADVCGQGPLCNDNGDCFDGDGPECPDCQVQQCDFSGHCDEFESELSCSDCVPCNGDTVCLATEHPSSCSDCSGIPCTHDFVCTAVIDGSGDEVGRCDDCVTLCDEGCGGDQGCTDFNRRLCQELGNDNCRFTEAEASVCRVGCFDDVLACPQGTTCVRDDFGNRMCEPKRCDEATPCPDGNDVCSGPVDMDRGAGFCLQRCDPLACAFFDDTPGACSCTSDNNPPFTRCAPVHDGGAKVIDFACTVPGPSSFGQPCNVQGDCGEDLACFSGTCRALCNGAGDNCPAGTCESITAAVSVCVEF